MNLCALVLGLSVWTARGGAHGVALSLAGALVVGGVLLPGYVLGLMGAADVKAGAAVGAMVSLRAVGALLAASFGATLLFSLYVMLVVEGASVTQMVQRTVTPHGSLARARAKNTTLPFALCLSVGAAWAARGGALWRG